MFKKILIANRGEIACRVIKTARRLGVQTVAVYSEADASSRHVQMADEAVCVGPSAARDSYLVGQRIVDAAMATGAQAIHPGYGFLSENDGFARLCADNNLVFIGPPVDAIRAMGLKAESKALMATAGVPLTPGYHGSEQSPEFLRERAREIGYPVLIKASAGGGGKGMRLVESDDAFEGALASCQREASAAFGNADVLVEKYIVSPRHIEVQVFGDSHGNAVHLFERDCSVQRRHQKVIEEAPAPGMTAERRAAMGKAAVDAALAVNYVGAGTVEFIADQEGAFYFMEMNTRLQVEHPVTEMITGQDLVEWQLRVAAGEPLPATQDELSISGHAVEARIYAEDPARRFLPSTGHLAHLRFAPESDVIRVDTGVREGDDITPFYDPMIAKLISWGPTRDVACARLTSALADTEIVGVRNNVKFLGAVINSPSFGSANLDTGLIEREGDNLFTPPDDETRLLILRIAVAAELHRQQQQAAQQQPGNPWFVADGWRLNTAQPCDMTLDSNGQTVTVQAHYLSDGYRLGIDGDACVVRVNAAPAGGDMLSMSINGTHLGVRVVASGNERHLFTRLGQHMVTLHDRFPSIDVTDQDGGSLSAPMPGKLIQLVAAPGQAVRRGDSLLVMEAMKMEHTIAAPSDGTVTTFRFAVGDQVNEGDVLVDFEAKA